MKSLKLNRLRLALTASISLMVVTNAILLVNSSKGLLVPALVFVFTFLPVYVLLLDTVSHYRQNLTLFRSMGAKKITVAASLLVSLVSACFAGAFAGILVGLMLTLVSPSTIHALPILVGIGYVLGSFVAGLAAAIIVVVMFSWNKLN